MKKTVLRNNIRKLPANTLQSKATHSQSPTHKKLLKKIELTQREATNQYEMSLQENLVFQKPQEEVVDFRVEIERRFQKSVANHTYVFPRSKLGNQGQLDDSMSSHDDSMESLRHVTVYELVSQNKKKVNQGKLIYRTQDGYMTTGRDYHNNHAQDNGNYRIQTEPDRGLDSEEEEYDAENPDTPIEISIRDKSSTAYRSLMNLLEKQLNKPPSSTSVGKNQNEAQNETNSKPKEEHATVTNQQPAQLREIKNTTQEKKITTNVQAKSINIPRDETPKSMGYQMGKFKIGDTESKTIDKSESAASFHDGIERLKKSTKPLDTSQRSKLVQGREKVNSFLESSQTGGESMLSLDNRLSPNARKGLNDVSKTSQDKKKGYSASNTNGILRALTPKYMASKNISSWKDKTNLISKAQGSGEGLMSSQTLSSSLYQKAKDDVLNGKLRSGGQKAQKKPITNENEVSQGDKGDVSQVAGANFTSFYGSPKGTVGKATHSLTQTIYNNFAKAKNIRKADASVGDKSTDRQSGYVSYDLTGKKTADKQSFKLDLSSRVQKQRDLLSSTRTRDNQSKEKSSDMLSIDSILKTSYDMHNHSLVRNTSKQADASKRKVGMTPKGNLKSSFLS